MYEFQMCFYAQRPEMCAVTLDQSRSATGVGVTPPLKSRDKFASDICIWLSEEIKKNGHEFRYHLE